MRRIIGSQKVTVQRRQVLVEEEEPSTRTLVRMGQCQKVIERSIGGKESD